MHANNVFLREALLITIRSYMIRHSKGNQKCSWKIQHSNDNYARQSINPSGILIKGGAGAQNRETLHVMAPTIFKTGKREIGGATDHVVNINRATASQSTDHSKIH